MRTTALVVTSINPPTPILEALAAGARRAGITFIVAGDTKSPSDFALEGCDFLDVEAQRHTGFTLAAACPTRHYARKNIGYLVAIHRGAELILETDDDNWPADGFFDARPREVAAASLGGDALSDGGWANLYRYFTDAAIWPRGLPLDAVHAALPAYESLAVQTRDCPIQQGLADENPDVDAIYRLLLPLPQRFRRDRRLALGPGAWCPFNSQNTLWWRDAFPLMYLPAFCSFRMTDIWRSFVAQRIAAENGWWILFHEPTVWQERNEHNLMRDFTDEVSGYLHNRAIGHALAALSLRAGRDHLGDNLRRCYDALITLGVVGEEERGLLDAWLNDLQRATSSSGVS
jgi:hypothetical protein